MRCTAFLAALLAVFAGTPASADPPASLETMQAVRSSADKLWGECVAKKARELAAASHEPAETVATAAMGACQQWEGAVREVTTDIAAGLDDASERTARLVSERHAHWREQAVLAVIEARR